MRKWSDDDLKRAVQQSFSYRNVLIELKLRPTGGNYKQLKKYIDLLKININHFKGQGWNAGLRGIGRPRLQLSEILTDGNSFQSFKLKKRLFKAGFKRPMCEECGWAKRSDDGRIPVELDHINGNSKDNRLENLRILCPNCHSLKSTHRGKNKRFV